MKTLENYIKVVNLVPNQLIDDAFESDAVDMQAAGTFDTALITVDVGAITGTPDEVAVSIIESDNSDLSSSSVIKGGDEVAVAAETGYTFQVERTKRYIGLSLAFTGGTTPDAQVSAIALLTNWARPFPLR